MNFVAGIIFLIFLFNLVGSMSPAANGIAVDQISLNSPAATAGIQHGDFILKVNGTSYNDGSVLASQPWYKPGEVLDLTVYRGGNTFQMPGVTLAANANNKSLGFLGISDFSFSDLKGIASGYTGAFFSRPLLYFCIPSFPRCQTIAPFSDEMSAFYSSGYGPWLILLANLSYWMFFLNFNLAIFNALPIYPLDGGQAFQAGLKGLAKGKVSEGTLSRISSGVTLLVLFMVASLPLAAYLNLI